jgi:hypothetical protein
MDAEFKEGDEVYYKKYIGDLKIQKKYRIVKVRQLEVPEGLKRVSKQSSKSLYGKELEEAAKPGFYFLIEPVQGGEPITALQGELELVGPE